MISFSKFFFKIVRIPLVFIDNRLYRQENIA